LSRSVAELEENKASQGLQGLTCHQIRTPSPMWMACPTLWLSHWQFATWLLRSVDHEPDRPLIHRPVFPADAYDMDEPLADVP